MLRLRVSSACKEGKASSVGNMCVYVCVCVRACSVCVVCVCLFISTLVGNVPKSPLTMTYGTRPRDNFNIMMNTTILFSSIWLRIPQPVHSGPLFTSLQGDRHRGGGSASSEVGQTPPLIGYYGIRSMSGRCSHWNAFLLRHWVFTPQLFTRLRVTSHRFQESGAISFSFGTNIFCIIKELNCGNHNYNLIKRVGQLLFKECFLFCCFSKF